MLAVSDRLMGEKRRYLIAAALLPFGVDIICTLGGQSATHWQADYAVPNESNAVGFRLLALHPMLFVGGAVLYAMGIALAIRYLPAWLAVWLSFGYFVAHTSGVNSWLGYHAIGEPIHNMLAAGWGAYCYWCYFRQRFQSE
jgi:mannose/fructose/N-acetylgalactosamine-specific phosphotransferase system component IIC